MPQGIYNLDWFAHNETIKYPIDSKASFVPDGYDTLPSGLMGVITDISICSTSTTHPYLSAITITDKMVTLVIALEYKGNTSGHAYLIFSDLQENITPGRYYNLIPRGFRMLNGVICFGSGIKNHYCSYKFSSPAQSGFLPAVCHHYEYPVRSFTTMMLNANDLVFGDVKFNVSSNIVAKIEEIRPQVGEDGEPMDPVKAITFSLNTELGIDELEKYLSICDARPENYSFPDKGIQSIGGATPDENGNVNIVFEDIHADSDSTGITILSTDYALEDICGDDRPPLEGEDECPYPPYLPESEEEESSETPEGTDDCHYIVKKLNLSKDVYGSGIEYRGGVGVRNISDNGTVNLDIPSLRNLKYFSIKVRFPSISTQHEFCKVGLRDSVGLHNCMIAPDHISFDGTKINGVINDSHYKGADIVFNACTGTATLTPILTDSITFSPPVTIADQFVDDFRNVEISLRGTNMIIKEILFG